MRIEPILIPPPFKCHSKTTEKIRDYGKVIKDTGFINGKNWKFTQRILVRESYYTSCIILLTQWVIGLNQSSSIMTKAENAIKP